MYKLFIVFFISVSIVSYSQDSYTSNRLKAGSFDGDTRKFHLNDYYTDVNLLIKNDTLHVSDSAHSIYVMEEGVLEQNNPNVIVTSYNAFDEKNKKCVIFKRISKTSEESSIVIVYNNYILQYFLTNQTK